MPIDESAYRRLEEEAGRRSGHLSVEDMGRILPLDSMSASDVAEIVDRLERAGIDVDIDPVLTLGRPDPTSNNSDGVVTMAAPAAPAISSPRVYPSKPADLAGMGDPRPHGHHHGRNRVPTWNVDGVEMLPLLAIGIVALFLIVALS